MDVNELRRCSTACRRATAAQVAEILILLLMKCYQIQLFSVHKTLKKTKQNMLTNDTSASNSPNLYTFWVKRKLR